MGEWTLLHWTAGGNPHRHENNTHIKRSEKTSSVENSSDLQKQMSSRYWINSLIVDDLHGTSSAQTGTSCCSAPEKPKITQNQYWCRLNRPSFAVRREMSPSCGQEVLLHDLVKIPAEPSFLKIKIYFHTAVSWSPKIVHKRAWQGQRKQSYTTNISQLQCDLSFFK